MPKKKIIGLFKKQSSVLNAWLCKYYPFPISVISRFEEKINWKSLSSNLNINWDIAFIEKYSKRFDWPYEICVNPSLPWSTQFILKFDRRLQNKEKLSSNTGIPWTYELIDTLKYKWNWNWLVYNNSIPWTPKMIVDFNLFPLNLSNILDRNLWTEDFISKYKKEIKWAHLCYNPSLPWSDNFIDRYKNYWVNEEKCTNKWTVSPWKGVSQNSGINWTLQFIRSYSKIPIIRSLGLYWTEMSQNESIPFQNDIFQYYKNKWDWIFLSSNNNLFITNDQIEQNKHKIIWTSKDKGRQTIASNRSLPWSEELIDKYLDKWDWHELSMNEGIPWSEEIIHKYQSKLQTSLFRNKSLPWSLDFILNHENKCFDVWVYSGGQISEKIWNTSFKPILDDNLVEEILTTISK